MSQENIEIVRRIWEAWERRDKEAPEVPATRGFCTPETLAAGKAHEKSARRMLDAVVREEVPG